MAFEFVFEMFRSAKQSLDSTINVNARERGTELSNFQKKLKTNILKEIVNRLCPFDGCQFCDCQVEIFYYIFGHLVSISRKTWRFNSFVNRYCEPLLLHFNSMLKTDQL